MSQNRHSPSRTYSSRVSFSLSSLFLVAGPSLAAFASRADPLASSLRLSPSQDPLPAPATLASLSPGHPSRLCGAPPAASPRGRPVHTPLAAHGLQRAPEAPCRVERHRVSEEGRREAPQGPQGGPRKAAQPRPCRGVGQRLAMDVRLNVYDLPNAQSTNEALRSLGIGLYHSGVVIRDYEYSFSAGGISRTSPRLPEFGIFRESIVIGRFSGSMNDLYLIVEEMRSGTFRAGAYDLIHLNCNHFADEFSFALTQLHIPEWVNRAASMAASISTKPAAQKFEDFSSGGFALPGKISDKSPIYGGAGISTVGPAPSRAPGAAPAALPPKRDSSSSLFSWFGGLFGGSDSSASSSSSSNSSTSSSITTTTTPASSIPSATVKENLETVDTSKKRTLTPQQILMLEKMRSNKEKGKS